MLSAVLASLLFAVALNLSGGDGERRLVVLRRKYPDVTRPYAVPGGCAGTWEAFAGERLQ